MSVMKTKAEARANFEGSIATIPTRYTNGIMRADWAGPAASDQAEANYAAGVSAAVTLKTRQTKIRGMTNVDWQTGAKTKGAPIIGERIRLALPKWEAAWGPMYDQIVSLVPTLPAKTIDPMTNIDARLKKVVETWRKAAGKT